MGNHSAAIIRDAEILKKWRNAIKQAVSEGESYENFAKAYSPNNEVKTDSEKLAMKLVTFELVDIYQVRISFKMTKKEKACQHTEDIVASTKISEAIQLTWMKPTEEGSVGPPEKAFLDPQPKCLKQNGVYA